jgi:hypothetical protein
MMNEKDMLERLRIGARYYNDKRLAQDLQKEEVDKFVRWMYQQYGIVYKDSRYETRE